MFKHLMIVGVVFLGGVATAEAATWDAALCGTLEDARVRSENFTRNQFISRARGDLKGMGEAINTFYTTFAARCGAGDATSAVTAQFRQYCDADCHKELIGYYQFMANNLEYYYNKTSNKLGMVEPDKSPLDTEALSGYVTQGLRFAESGLKLISEASAANNSASFKGLMYESIGFDLSRVRLYMALGDIQYRTASNRRLTRLHYKLGNALSKPSDAIAGETSPLAQASINYDQALWTLAEANLGIPDQSQFDGLAFEASMLQKQLQRRRDSVSQGFLYIGIDPDQYAKIGMSDLTQQLTELRAKVATVEGHIEAAITSFLNAKKDMTLVDIDDQQRYNQLSLNVSAYKIAKTESTLQEQANAIEQQKTLLETAQTSFELELRRAEALHVLQKNAMQLDLQLTALQNRKEVEVLQYKKSQNDFQFNKLQWVLNNDLALNNLQMQVSSLETQLFQLDSDLSKLKLSQAQKQIQIDQIQGTTSANPSPGRIGMAQNRWQQAQLQIDALEQQRTSVFQSTNDALAYRICEVENRIGRLASPTYQLPGPYEWTDGAGVLRKCEAPDRTNSGIAYAEKRCQVESGLAQAQITSTMDTLVCVVGPNVLPLAMQDVINSALASASASDATLPSSIGAYVTERCPTIQNNCTTALGAQCGGLYQNTVDIYQKKMASADVRVEAARKSVNDLRNTLSWLQTQFATQIVQQGVNAIAKAKAAKDAAQSAQQAVSMIATVSVETVAAGANSGTITKQNTVVRIVEAAKAAIEVATSAAEIASSALSYADMALEWENALRQMGNKITQAEATLRDTDISREILTIASAEAIMEMTKTGLDLTTQFQTQFARYKLDNLDCSKQQIDLAAEVSRLAYQREALVSEVTRVARQNSLLDSEIQKLKLEQHNEMGQIEILTAEVASLEIDLQKLDEEILTIEGDPAANVLGLKQRYGEQKSRLDSMIARLNSAVQDADKLFSVRQTLDSQIFANTVDLTVQEISSVKNMLNENVIMERATKKLLDSIADTQIKNSIQTTNLLALYERAYSQIGQERMNMLSSAEQVLAEAQQGRRKEALLSNADLLASLTKGVPQYVESKQILMERANYLLSLLNNKVKAATSVATNYGSYGLGLTDNNDGYQFLRTGDDIALALDYLTATTIDSNAPIRSEVWALEIPRESGLARQLASELYAKLEIRPASLEEMERQGYFTLWHPSFDEPRGWMVNDLELVVNFFDNGCQQRNFNLSHTGSGYRFVLDETGQKPEPIFVTAPARSHDLSYWLTSTDIASWKNYWLRQDLSLFSLYRGTLNPPDDMNATLPFMGLPVLGTYEITLPPARSESSQGTCSYDNATFRLFVAAAKVQ